MKKKKFGIFGSLIFLSCAVVLLFVISNKNANRELTEEQINSLRAEYPIYNGEHPMLEMIVPTLDEVINKADTFVYGKVVGEVSHYYRNLSTGNEMLDKKHEENGLSNVWGYYEYTIEVIRDTQGIINVLQITITQNDMFEGYSPVLKDGMRIVAPVGRTGISEDKPLRYSYRKYGFYYVTEDGYVLSAVEEDAKTKKSGIQVDSLMKQLKQKKDDMLKSASNNDEVSE